MFLMFGMSKNPYSKKLCLWDLFLHNDGGLHLLDHDYGNKFWLLILTRCTLKFLLFWNFKDEFNMEKDEIMKMTIWKPQFSSDDPFG